MRRITGMFIALSVCAVILLTACSKEKQESPFAALDDTSSSSETPAAGGHPFASTSAPSSDKGTLPVSESVPPADSGGTSGGNTSESKSTPSGSSVPPQSSSSSVSVAPQSIPSATQDTPSSTVSVSATVRADGGLRLRAAAGTNGEKLLTIPDGAQITCTGWQDGWAKTSYEGKNGYVSADYLLFHGTVRADGGLRLRKGPGENYEKLLTIPDGTQIACMEQKDGWVKTSYDNETGYVSQTYVQVTAKVSAGPGLNLRNTPDETGTKLLTIPNGTQLLCTGNPEKGWAKVTYNGVEGYVSAAYLSFAP